MHSDVDGQTNICLLFVGFVIGGWGGYATFNLNSSLRRPQRKLWQKFSRMHMRRKSEVMPTE